MPRFPQLADWLREAGLTTVEVDGWKTRGSEAFNPGGVILHHTAGAATGDMPSLRVLINGRPDLPGPLCQVGLARSGICYVVAAGRSNHAGRGGWKGMVGNSAVWGIEAENRGTSADPWPKKQIDAYHALTAVLQEHTAHGPFALWDCGHKEWAPGRKVDPHTLNLAKFRVAVQAILNEEDDMDEATLRKVLDEYVGKPYKAADGTSLTANQVLAEKDATGYVDGVKFAIGFLKRIEDLVKRIATKVGA